jgi:hypothetical protein
MKHLKRFNENKNEDFLKEIEEMCNNYLAFLSDIGFVFGFRQLISSYVKGVNEVIVTIKKPEQYNGAVKNVYFKLNDVKDHLIPFLHVLDNDFGLRSKYGFHNSPVRLWLSHRDEDVSHISIDELDELDELDMDVQAIQFFIKQPNDL